MTAIAAGLLHPFQWFLDTAASRREARRAAEAMRRALGICSVCHEGTASAATDHRCDACQLEIASVP